MTMDLSMGLIPNVLAKGGERGGKGAPAEASGFDEALAAGTMKRMPQERRGDGTGEARPQWRIAGVDDPLAAAMPQDRRIGQFHVSLRDLLLPAEPEAAPKDRLESPEDSAADAVATQAMPDAADALPAATAAPPAVEAPPPQQARQRGDRDRPVHPAQAADAPGSENAADGEDVARLRGRTAPPGADTPETAAKVARQTADRQQPVAAVDEPGSRQARPTAQVEGAAEQRAQRPAPAAQRVDAPAMTSPSAEPAQPRVSVLGFSTSTAPALPVQLGTTAAGLVAAIEAEPAWRAAAAEAASAAVPRGQNHGSVSTLRIQLNPAELGMVTARLTAAGPQLEIEIRVESGDARQRLTNDSDAIVKALRAVGYDIDKVTIQQAPQGSGAAQQQGASGRDSFLQGQGQERADANARGRDGQGSESGGKASRHGAGDAAADRSGGGVYI